MKISKTLLMFLFSFLYYKIIYLLLQETASFRLNDMQYINYLHFYNFYAIVTDSATCKIQSLT